MCIAFQKWKAGMCWRKPFSQIQCWGKLRVWCVNPGGQLSPTQLAHHPPVGWGRESEGQKWEKLMGWRAKCLIWVQRKRENNQKKKKKKDVMPEAILTASWLLNLYNLHPLFHTLSIRLTSHTIQHILVSHQHPSRSLIYTQVSFLQSLSHPTKTSRSHVQSVAASARHLPQEKSAGHQGRTLGTTSTEFNRIQPHMQKISRSLMESLDTTQICMDMLGKMKKTTETDAQDMHRALNKVSPLC